MEFRYLLCAWCYCQTDKCKRERIIYMYDNITFLPSACYDVLIWFKDLVLAAIDEAPTKPIEAIIAICLLYIVAHIVTKNICNTFRSIRFKKVHEKVEKEVKKKATFDVSLLKRIPKTPNPDVNSDLNGISNPMD